MRSRVLGIVPFLLLIMDAQRSSSAENEQPQAALRSVFELISSGAKEDAWLKGEWDDKALSDSLEKVLVPLKEAIPARTFQPPASFKRGYGNNTPPGVYLGRGTVGQNLNINICRNSYILAAGDIHIESAEDSVVIARGLLTITNAKRCLLITGVQAYIVLDSANVIISKGWACTEHSENSTIAAPEGVVLNNSEAVLLVNCVPLVHPARRATFETIKSDRFALGAVECNALATRIMSKGLIVRPSPVLDHEVNSSKPIGLLFAFKASRDVIAYKGKAVRDENGEPIEALSGWVLDYVGGAIAQFRKEDDRMIVPLIPK
jgi:hypothetical protein